MVELFDIAVFTYAISRILDTKARTKQFEELN
jgi:hypothetical protein